MVPLILQHIDAVIMIVAGAILVATGGKKPAASTPGELTAKTHFLAQHIRKIGAGMLCIGVLLIVIEKARTTESWRRVPTADATASAEFPYETKSEATTETDGKRVLKKTIIRSRYPDNQLELALVQTERSPEDQLLSGDEWILFLEDHLQSKGANIVALDKKPFGAFFGYHVVIESKDGKGRTTIRGILTPKTVYELATASTPQSHENPAIQKFTNSFQLEKPTATPAATESSSP